MVRCIGQKLTQTSGSNSRAGDRFFSACFLNAFTRLALAAFALLHSVLWPYWLLRTCSWTVILLRCFAPCWTQMP